MTVPAGLYDLEFVGIEEKVSAHGKEYFYVHFKVVDPPFDGEDIYGIFSMSPAARWVWEGAVEHPYDLATTPVTGEVKLEQYQGKEVNRVQKLHSRVEFPPGREISRGSTDVEILSGEVVDRSGFRWEEFKSESTWTRVFRLEIDEVWIAHSDGVVLEELRQLLDQIKAIGRRPRS